MMSCDKLSRVLGSKSERFKRDSSDVRSNINVHMLEAIMIIDGSLVVPKAIMFRMNIAVLAENLKEKISCR